MYVISNKKGMTLIEILICVGILCVLVLSFFSFFFGGMKYIAKGVDTNPEQIAREILQGKPGIQKGLVEDIRGLYSIYDGQIDSGTVTVTLYSDKIILGYGIVDSIDGIAGSHTVSPTDYRLITSGSATTTSFIKGTPTIPVVAPTDTGNPTGTYTQTLESGLDVLSDDYKLIKSYAYYFSNNQGWIIGTVTKISPISTLNEPFKIGKNITRLEFKYFTGDGQEIGTGTVSRLDVNKIRLIEIILWVDKDDDKDGKVVEDPEDEIDNDEDGRVDEDDFNGVKLITRVFPRNLNLNP
ncbi:MAG: prepilin-type N-terminal cleavage/methylation domain-containing protein [bacterium]|nr:prepilin-type N-terminal cleavage/methylation domain-containing protein [bacterium]